MADTFFLTCLGTGTKYQPYKAPDHNGEKRGDSLSYVHSRFSGVGRQYFNLSKNKGKILHQEWLIDGVSSSERPEGKLTHCLLEGSDAIGAKVYERIAQGVIESLNAMMRGDETICIFGHSRGAVEAVLIAHELDRIKKVIMGLTKQYYFCKFNFILRCFWLNSNLF